MSQVPANSRSVRVVTSPRAADRVEACVAWLASGGKAEPALVVGASTEAAAEVIRRAALRTGGGFGWHRATLAGLGVDLARAPLAAKGLAPASPLAIEAVAARVVARLAADGGLGRFAPVAHMPGLPRALARTLGEVRLAGLSTERLPDDLRPFADRFREALEAAGLADRAAILGLAADLLEAGAASPYVGVRTILLDVPVGTGAEARLVRALAGRAPAVLAAVPEGDRRTLDHLAALVPADALPHAANDALGRLQARLFSPEVPVEGALGEVVSLLSAPGESRECVEIARRIHDEAGRGVPFDRMAILLHGPAAYRAHVVEALRRADVPAWYARGTRAPDPAGRALLALLACRAEGLSARRFAEYLSLGEVPDAEAGAPPAARPASDRYSPPDDEAVPGALARAQAEIGALVEATGGPVSAGTLRAPRHWERILVDAAVIGGLDRWRRRLAGWRKQLEIERDHLDEPEEARRSSFDRRIAEIDALRDYALPLLEALEALPDRAAWGEWLDHMGALATRAIRHPDHVLAVLAELRPMAPVGPVGLDEVRLVLGPRLSELDAREANRPYGRVFVGPIDAARGLDFDVVFVPGLAERLFPQKVVEDPMLLDAGRAGLPGLVRQEDRVATQRLALRLAIGAASKRLVLSWPRVDVEQSRPRVPSFYGLEVVRAAEGALPGFEDLARRAESAAAAHLGWPAPEKPDDAIDAAEHDLALLHAAFHEGGRPGAARYLLEANPHLARALRARQRRWFLPKMTEADGLVSPRPEALAALRTHLPAARSYSATALQNLAACPYRFLLQAVHRLEPREEPAAIEHLDPLSRGSLVHEVQFALLTALRSEGRLPVRPPTLPDALDRLDAVLVEVAGRFRDDLAPAIDRVWQDGIDRVRADLREWLRREADDTDWTPWRFELSFGLGWQPGRDENSRAEAVALDEGIQLRGSIDLVEVNATDRVRVTDYKTGKVSVAAGAVTSGGRSLQPALYALAAEKMFPGRTVTGGRLYYCTQRGDYTSRPVPLDDEARAQVALVARTLRDRVDRGDLPAWPDEGECTFCNYRSVCGPREEERVAVKDPEPLADLVALRELK